MKWERALQTIRCIIGLLFFSFIAACSAPDGRLPPAHQVTSNEDPENFYRIGPLDTLSIFVWQQPELSLTLQVRPDGHISMPLIADLRAANKTTAELAGDIKTALSTTIRNPVVTVVAAGFNGTYDQQVRVIGEATNPQALQYQANMTLMDVMIRVGGLTQYAAGNRGRLIRFDNGSKKVYSVRIADLVLRGDIDANVRVRPGDVIVIPGTVF